MGIEAHYRRIPAPLLADFVASPNFRQIQAFIRQDLQDFPKSLRYFYLGKVFDAFHRLLNPTEATHETPLWKVVEGGTSFERGVLDEYGLGEIRYLTPDEVHEIAQAMGTLDYFDLRENYMRYWQIDDLRNDTEIALLPSLYLLFQTLFCFFQIAAEANDGVLLWID